MGLLAGTTLGTQSPSRVEVQGFLGSQRPLSSDQMLSVPSSISLAGESIAKREYTQDPVILVQ